MKKSIAAILACVCGLAFADSYKTIRHAQITPTNRVVLSIPTWAQGDTPPESGANTNTVNNLIRAYDTTNLTARINAKQNKLADYTTTNAVCNLVTNNVAPWAMKGKPEPVGGVTNVCTNGVSIVSSKVADIYGPVRAIASSASVTNAGAVAVAAADATAKANAAKDEAIGAITVRWDSGAAEGSRLKHGDTSVTASDVGAFPAMYDEDSGRYLTSASIEFTEGLLMVDYIGAHSSNPTITGAFSVDVDFREEGNENAIATLGDITAENAGALSIEGGTVSGSTTFEGSLEVYNNFYATGISTSYDGQDESALYFNKWYYIPDGTSKSAAREIAVKGDIPSQSTIETYATNAVANSDNLWNQSNAKLTATIDGRFVATNTAFSNAVLSVGLNIDTNAVAVLNEIASGFDGFTIAGTATTVGGLLAALAAAVAWLKTNKADKSEVPKRDSGGIYVDI